MSSKSDEAIDVFRDREQSSCKLDLWTYNTMISVIRNGQGGRKLCDMLQAKGFLPDDVTYIALLYWFAKNGKVEKLIKFVGK